MFVPALSDSHEVMDTCLSGKDILRNLILQLKKDFLVSGIPLKISVTKKYSFSDLVEIIANVLSDVPAHQMFNILYRVDISETQLKKEMPSPGIDVQLFSALIIKRELQKIILRKLYHSNKSAPGW